MMVIMEWWFEVYLDIGEVLFDFEIVIEVVDVMSC